MTGATVGGLATSRILSAISANWGRVSVVEAEGNTILTEGGILRRNNWRTHTPSGGGPASPSSCCMCRSSCEGFRPPSFSAVSTCCSEASVCLTKARSRTGPTVAGLYPCPGHQCSMG